MSKKREMDENRTKYSLIRVKVERLQIGHICQFRRNISSQQVATKSKYLHVLKRPKLSGDWTVDLVVHEIKYFLLK